MFNTNTRKVCTKCGEEKPFSEFHRKSDNKDGLRSRCKVCHCAEVREYNAEHRKPSRYEKTHRTVDGIKQKLCTKCQQWKSYDRFWISGGSKCNKDRLNPSCKECRRERVRISSVPLHKICSICKTQKPIKEFPKSKRDGFGCRCLECNRKLSHRDYCRDIEASRAKARERYATESYRKYARERQKYLRGTNPMYRLYCNISRRIHCSIKNGKSGCHWEDLVGYTLTMLTNHLERRFREGMSWENYGQWHIDHRIPVSAFNYDKPEHPDFKRCWALDNLQPLWAMDNICKHAKIENHFQPMLKLDIGEVL